MQEVEKVYNEFSSKHFSYALSYSREMLIQRVHYYESFTEMLLAMMVVGCYWGEQSHQYLWTHIIERVASICEPKSGISYLPVWKNLSLYPALLLLYAGGIASLAAKQYDTFAALLLQPQVKEVNTIKPPALALYTWAVADKEIAQQLPDMNNRYTPLSDYLYDILREPLRDFIPQDERYTKCFDRFEYLFALVHSDLYEKQWNQFWGPVGSFGWRREIIDEIASESSVPGKDWLPLNAGLFNSSFSRFKIVQTSFNEYLKQSNIGRWY